MALGSTFGHGGMQSMDPSAIIRVILLGCVTGLLVGFLGIGGGVIVVPALIYLLGMSQHMAQGTSLFILLPPLGLGALLVYWKDRKVDLAAGIVCAAGLLAGGYFGGTIAVGIPARTLRILFGLFLMFLAGVLWAQSAGSSEQKEDHA
jgi:uncharacterized protein